MCVDQVFPHIKWVEWIKENLDGEITFPIVAANQPGMLNPGKGTNTVHAAKALPISDKNKVAMPADCPNNTLLNDRFIVPPANNIAEARKCKEQDNGHKPFDK